MTDVPTTFDNPDDRDAGKNLFVAAGSTRRQVVAVAVCLIAFRAYLVILKRSDIADWSFGMAPQGALEWLLVVALITSFLAAVAARRWFVRPIAFLFCVVFGAAATVPVSAIPGAVIGGLVGCCTLFPRGRRFVLVSTKWLALRVAPLLALSLGAGYGFARWIQTGTMQDSYVAVGFVFFALICCAAWNDVFRLRKSGAANDGSKTTAYARCFIGTVAGTAILVIGWIAGIECVNQSEYRLLTRSTWVDQPQLRPQNEWLTRGLTGRIGWLQISRSTTDGELRRLRRFDGPFSVTGAIGPGLHADGLNILSDRPITEVVLRGLDNERSQFLQGLKDLGGFEVLDSPSLGDEAVLNLRCYRTLTSINLSNTSVTDRAMMQLAKFRALQTINVANTEVSDTGVAALVRLPLRSINLAQTQVTPACIDTFKQMPSLIELNLDYTGIDVQSLEPLVKLPFILSLSISGSKLGKDEIQLLQKFPQLRSLIAHGCDVDDAAAMSLVGLPYLEVDCWNLTKATVDALAATGSDVFFWVTKRQVARSDIERLVSLGKEIHFEQCEFDHDAIEFLRTDLDHELLTIWNLNADDQTKEELSLNGQISLLEDGQ